MTEPRPGAQDPLEPCLEVGVRIPSHGDTVNQNGYGLLLVLILVRVLLLLLTLIILLLLILLSSTQ